MSLGLRKYLRIVNGPESDPQPRKARAKRVDREGPVQRSVIATIGAVAPYCYVAHIPNGGKRNARVAAQLKRDGVKPGMPDLLLVLSTGQVAFIECKAPGGSMTTEQKAFRDMCDQRAIHFACVDSAEGVPNLLRMWGEDVRAA